MKKTIVKSWSCKISIGLHKGYSNEIISQSDFFNLLEDCQRSVKKELGVYLSAAVTFGNIVFLGQVEPTAFLSFLQYPRLPQDETDLKNGVLRLAELLASEMEQNRVVLELLEETIMLENNQNIDPKIDLS
jgi:EAL domain-containing protein (putative c-di-GMP-specific phosphodiesterase class I)